MARPSRPWFRFYVEAVHDRKLRRLKPEHRWLFVACLAAARASAESGWLMVGEDDPMTWDDLCDFAGMSLRAVEQGTDALMDVGVLGYDQAREAWFVPNWSQRQYESDVSTPRVQKHRKERSNVVSGNGQTSFQGTAPETEADTDTETPPTPLLEQIVDRVFEKVLAEKARRGERITSTKGFRAWWDENEADGCRKKAAWVIQHYELSNVGQFADVTLAPSVPAWAGPYLKRPEVVA